eukprot:CAMPEP_0202966996 /NCGR_PEP_ID=MMETSP1396-20130829/11708_1 /ASSEMBLY_ACC=CAM_ASM_000872 /TAXON_ID= /ORGANISM="Pseudokeronopsis sp., Strain Brazil" /LENGTH=50 /DNA_ID=CAMNT_0049691551 /DNA_START=277 /DNA_END=426 /DNA_ORIENTATION=-
MEVSQMNLMITKKKHVAFVKIFENKLAPQFCEAGTSQLLVVKQDYLHNGI